MCSLFKNVFRLLEIIIMTVMSIPGSLIARYVFVFTVKYLSFTIIALQQLSYIIICVFDIFFRLDFVLNLRF